MRLLHAAFCTVLLVAVWTCVFPSSSAGASGLPLDRDFCRTSSFGSWRFGHIHAGIDLSTGGVTGAPVLAIDSCWVWRVSVGHEGYGKALYVRLPDGRIAVYGHLSAFAPEIERAVEREQDLRGSYSVDIYNEPYALRFKKGEVMALSGESGWGPPHLHFEIRSGMYEHLKIDPIPEYVECFDSRAPVIHSVKIVPLSGEVNGDIEPAVIGSPFGADTLLVSGDFGVMVNAEDYTGCGRRTSPVIYRAYVDTVCVWDFDLTRFPFSKTDYVWSIYHLEGDGAKYVRLFNPWKLDFNGFETSGADTGFGGFTPGLHVLRVLVMDSCGNEAQAEVPFRYGEFPDFGKVAVSRRAGAAEVEVWVSPPDAGLVLFVSEEGGPWEQVLSARPGLGSGGGKHRTTFNAGRGGLRVRCRAWTGTGLFREGVFGVPAPDTEPPVPELALKVTEGGIEITALAPEPPGGLPAALVFEGIFTSRILLQPVDEGIFRGRYTPRGEADAVQARAVFDYGGAGVPVVAGTPVACLKRASSAVLTTESFRLRIAVPRDMRPGVLLGYREERPLAYEGYTDSLGSIVFEPEGTFFGEKARVCLALREGALTVKQGVFADRGEKASFRGRADSSGVVCFETDFLEKLVVLEDREPPEIGDFQGRGRRDDGRYVFSAQAVDSGSGIDSETVAAFVDGEIAIAGFDPDTGAIEGRTTKALREGKHRFTLEVKDRMGNRASNEYVVSLD